MGSIRHPEKFDLLPCPFCGEKTHLDIKRSTPGSDWVQAGCKVCCCQGPYCQTQQQAADAWNTRYIAGTDAEPTSE